MATLWEQMTIHVGMPKCASTSLQCNLFAKCDGITYLGPESVHFPATLEPRHKVLMTLSGAEELYWAPRRDRVSEFLHGYFSPDRKAVISDEGIVHGYYVALPESCADRRLVAERYQALFPGARILLVIRNQFDYLASFFAEWNRRPFISYPNYPAWVDEAFQLHRNGMTSPLLLPDYWSLFALYRGLFGADRVHVVPLEGLPGQSQSLLETVAELLELPLPTAAEELGSRRENTRTRALQKGLARVDFLFPRLRRMLPRPLLLAAWDLAGRLSKPLATPLTVEQRRRLNDFYAPGNADLAAATGLPLADLGYPA